MIGIAGNQVSFDDCPAAGDGVGSVWALMTQVGVSSAIVDCIGDVGGGYSYVISPRTYNTSQSLMGREAPSPR